jgi:predicted PurR-regulated permease PerM
VTAPEPRPQPPPAGVTIRFDRQVMPWILLVIVVAATLYLFSGVLMPFVAGIALGYLLDPLAKWLDRLGLGRLGASLLILASFTVIIAILLVVFVPILGRQLAAFSESLPALVAKLQALASTGGDRLTDSWFGQLLEKFGINVAPGSTDLQKTANDLVSQAAGWAAAFLRSLITGGAALIGILSLIVVTPVVAFYILVDWDRMIATLDGLVPLRHREEVRALARDIDRALAGFLRGQSLVCVFLGLWYAIGLSLVGLNFGFLIGITAGVLSFIPYVGSLTALILSCAVALVQGWPEWRLLILSLGVVLTGQFLEGNVLSPKLVGASVGLHPVWLMFALLAFGSLFGFTGLIVAVPLAAAIGVLLRFAAQRYRASPLYLGRDLGGPVIESAPVRIEDRAGAT